MKQRRDSKGFTLIEVLVAMAVLAVALAALGKGSASHTANAAYLKERSVASWVAANQLAELQLDKKWPNVGKKSGKEKMAGVEWQWEAEVKKTETNDLRQIVVSVNQQGKDQAIARVWSYMANSALRDTSASGGKQQ